MLYIGLAGMLLSIGATLMSLELWETLGVQKISSLFISLGVLFLSLLLIGGIMFYFQPA